MKTTCQICGREIKANTGLIAHHGYRRQWAGFQSSSCRGARHVPYEVGTDALELEIGRLEVWLADVRARIIELTSNPPATLTRQGFSGFGRNRKFDTVEYQRPEGFDWKDRNDQSDYAKLHRSKHGELLDQLRHGKAELERLENRLLEWGQKPQS